MYRMSGYISHFIHVHFSTHTCLDDEGSLNDPACIATINLIVQM